MNSNVTIGIIADRKSLRAVESNALLEKNGKHQIEAYVEKFLHSFENIIVVSNDDITLKWEQVKVVKNAFTGAGPLAGILSVLENSNTEKNIFIGCDQPFISNDFLNFLADFENEENILVASESGKIQPFPGIYSRKNLKLLRTILETNEQIPGRSDLLKMTYFIKTIDAEVVEVSNKPFYHSRLFMNAGTEDDFARYKNMIIN